MRAEDFQAFRDLLTDVMAYYGKDVSGFMADTWWGGCRAFELEQVATAMRRHAADPESGQYPPKLADVVRILQGTHTHRAQLAWGKALDAMSRVGAYTDVIFEDPAIHACIEDLGGWPKVCRTPTSELSYLQHRFCESHKAYTGRDSFDYPKRLAGDRSPDSEYEKKGLPLPRPALIGDPAKCKLVYQGGSSAGKTAITYTPVQALVLENLMPRIAA